MVSETTADEAVLYRESQFALNSLIGQQFRYRPTNKWGRRPATKPARPRRTRAQKLRTQARRAR